MSHHTHRQQLARELSQRCEIPYQRALAFVEHAAERGLLPRTLDATGRAAAIAGLVALVEDEQLGTFPAAGALATSGVRGEHVTIAVNADGVPVAVTADELKQHTLVLGSGKSADAVLTALLRGALDQGADVTVLDVGGAGTFRRTVRDAALSSQTSLTSFDTSAGLPFDPFAGVDDRDLAAAAMSTAREEDSYWSRLSWLTFNEAIWSASLSPDTPRRTAVEIAEALETLAAGEHERVHQDQAKIYRTAASKFAMLIDCSAAVRAGDGMRVFDAARPGVTYVRTEHDRTDVAASLTATSVLLKTARLAAGTAEAGSCAEATRFVFVVNADQAPRAQLFNLVALARSGGISLVLHAVNLWSWGEDWGTAIENMNVVVATREGDLRGASMFESAYGVDTTALDADSVVLVVAEPERVAVGRLVV